MTDIAANLRHIRQDIQTFAERYGRAPGDITLLAVSKTKPVAALRQAVAAGQSDFGENYLDEALEKIDALRDCALRWHFIGSIQSRKARDIARHFDWVHTIDRLKVAEKLSANRPAGLPPLQCCLQVNIDREDSKSGVMPEELPALLRQVEALPALQVRGLMVIPAPAADFAAQRDSFRRTRELMDSLHSTVSTLDTLSMGMSGDMEAAIAEGASMVRIGTAIFGARTTHQ
ncbi:YggS family pyridoxal phosphate-dependent enzyme [Granulosicoccaceae sp. 1_MG-2023]|nr:YggS family pyridoxal phosphate-dependent enzyme [Granulosicoccaceae sp. 1_MG-2023]